MNDFNPQREAPEENKRRNFNRPHAFLWTAFLSTIIAIIALVIAFICYETVERKHENIKTIAYSQQQAIQANIQQLRTDLMATQQNVTQLMQRLGHSQQQTALSQIAYLINLANLQLSVSHDNTAALHILSLAQAKVEALSDPQLFALNKVLLKDIAELKAVPTFDVTKVIGELDNLSDAIDQATLTPNHKDLQKAAQQSANDVAKTDTNKKDRWYKRAWHHISGVKDLIIIRKNNTNIHPLLDTQQQQLIKSAIQSKLLLAEYAAIQHNNTLFQKHLATVEQWIKKYFFDSVDREQLLSQLKVIQSTNVSPKIPDINDTITVLNQTLDALTNSIATPSQPPTVQTTPSSSTSKQAPKQPKKTTPNNMDNPTNNNAGVAI